jgi:ATP-binding cassette subfamily F protein 3
MEEYEAQQALIEKEEEYIRRNLAGQTTNQAKGRRTRLERLLETARITPPVQPRSLRFRLTPALRSGDLVLRTYGLGVGYQDEGRVLFRVPDLTLRRGECAAVIGPNGAGKTTFLKTILGQIPPLQGEVQLGASLEVGYFAQAHEGLQPERSLMQEIEAAAPQMRPAEIRDYLAKFLFTGEDVFKTVALLSGGERGRLALAILALSNANLLLLDEPTNHLDLPSQEVLQAVLGAFGGTILLVSHDRYLIDALATQVWEVFPERGALRVFEGDYSRYRQALATEEAARQAEKTGGSQSRPKAVQAQRTQSRSTNRERERQRRIEQLEGEIEMLEAQLAQVGRRLENPPADAGKVQQLGQEYVQLQQAIDERLHAWNQLLEEG